MDLSRVKSITIAHLDFLALTNRQTSNPIAEAEVPEMLRQAIRNDVKVILTDPLGQRSCQLVLSKDGGFEYAPLA